MNLGGIDKVAIIKFQTRVQFGKQYARVIEARDESDIIVACLRVAWNDAFRHVSQNCEETNKQLAKTLFDFAENVREEASRELGKYAIDDDSIVSEWICQKILHKDGKVYKIFLEWAQAKDSRAKYEIAKNAIAAGMLEEFGRVKLVNSKKNPLCFGHIQKLYNMALKNYICLYCWREELGIREFMGKTISETHLANADCPIDSVILKQLDNISAHNQNGKHLRKYKKFENIKWSKLGTPSFPEELYCELQNCIKKHMQDSTNSNLFFDFENWS